MRKAYEIFNTAANGILSLVYPNNCAICDKELPDGMEHMCFACRDELHFTYFEKFKEPSPADELFWGRIDVENVFPLLYFQKGSAVQKILHKIKYGEGKQIGSFMGEMIGGHMNENEKFRSIEALIPIPLHSKKGFKRGYNQSLMIARGIAEETEKPIVEGLVRNVHRASQTTKGKEERWKNVQSIFEVRPDTLQNKTHVAIVDDVLTTGSTLESAAKTIRSYYPDLKISFLTVAIAD